MPNDLPANNLIQTGIAGLDQLLGGGLPTGSLLLVQGAAGTGKTVLLQQLGFNWIRQQGSNELTFSASSSSSFSPPSPSSHNSSERFDAENPSLTQEQVPQHTPTSTTSPGSRKAIFFTTFSEPHLKLFQHMAPFTFFDEMLITQSFKFLSLASVLEEDLTKAANFIVSEVRHEGAGLVLLDGLGTLEVMGGGRPALQRFLYQLSSQLGILGVTLVISHERDLQTANDQKELTIADGVVSLTTELEGANRVRRIEVTKFRGMDILLGLHTYRITRDGIFIYPRLEALVNRAQTLPQKEATPAPLAAPNSAPVPVEQHKDQRLKFNIPELDQILGGGLPVNSSTVLAGSFGTGKTLFALHYLIEGASKGEVGLYFGFRETAAQLLQKARQFGLDLQTPLDAGLIRVLTFIPVENELDVITTSLQEQIEKNGIKRLVVDTLGEFQKSSKSQNRTFSFNSALLHYLNNRGITTIYNLEISQVIGSALDLSETSFIALAENLLIIRQVEYSSKLYRIITVLKMRDSAYDNHIRQFVIEDGSGLKVLEPVSGSQELLSGIASKMMHNG